MKVFYDEAFALQRLCELYYTPSQFAHAQRVAQYCSDSIVIPTELKHFCIELAYAHDLLEDTAIEPVIFDTEFLSALKRLTHNKKAQSYAEYCKSIKMDGSTCPPNDWELAAWFVKLADMKDHLNLKDTLTDKLKEKYLEGLAELL